MNEAMSIILVILLFANIIMGVWNLWYVVRGCLLNIAVGFLNIAALVHISTTYYVINRIHIWEIFN